MGRLADKHWGRQNSPLCFVHPWKPTVNSQPGGFRINQHICVPTGEHVPLKVFNVPIEDYTRWTMGEGD
jgi:hypothetical protein